MESKRFNQICFTKYIFPFFQQKYCTPPICGELSEYTDSAHTQVEDLSSRYMNGSDEYDTTQDKFILPAPPVGGLPNIPLQSSLI